MKEEEKIRLVQKRIAETCVGASTLHRKKGTADAIRKILIDLDLSDVTENFEDWLDKKTKAMERETKCDWGMCRKCLNIFLMECFYNRFLYQKYKLSKIEELLELPLDSNSIKELRKLDEDKKLTKIHNNAIKRLKPEINKEYQDLANKEAVKEGLPARVFLDLELWRKWEPFSA